MAGYGYGYFQGGVPIGSLLNPLMGNITVLKEGDYTYLRTSFSETQDIVQKLFVGTTDYAFSPAFTTYIIDKSTVDTANQYEAGTLIHIASDDCTPLSTTPSYLGAMHGLSSVIEITSAGHGKVIQDVGSVWKDTVNREWTIIKVIDINKLVFLSKNRLTYPEFNFYISITGGLTHVANATNTDAIAVTSQAAAQQLPVIKNRVFSAKINGNTLIVDDGIYKANTVVFEEIYDVVNPASALLNIQSQVCSSEQPDFNVGDTLFTSDTKFTYYDNSACLVLNKFTLLQDITAIFYGFTQSGPLYASGLLSKLKEYIPKSLPITLSGTPYDFRIIKDITTMPAAARFTPEYWENAESPPERTIQFLSNSGDELQIGFALGYLKGKGVEINLKDSANEVLWVHTSKKQYPKALSASGYITTNQVYEGYCFRNYFDAASLPANKIGQYFVKDGNDTYLYLDYNGVIEDTITMPENLIGKAISILEKSANVAIVDTVVAATLVVDVTTATPESGFAILKIV